MRHGEHNHDDSRKRRLVARHVAAHVSQLPGVIAIVLAGSTGAGVADECSDVDLDVYALATIALDQRAALARELADPPHPSRSTTTSGSPERVDRAWEWYRGRHPVSHAQWIEDQLDRVLVHHEASLGYTTCFWHAVSTSHSLYDPTGWYAELQDRARIPYPEPLRRAILAKNYPVLGQIRSSYAHQIAAAVARRDTVSLNHRVAALLASYFDVLFALNRVLHPGEKRLVEYAERTCAEWPEHMVDDVAALTQALGAADQVAVSQQVTTLLNRLDTLLRSRRHRSARTALSRTKSLFGNHGDVGECRRCLRTQNKERGKMARTKPWALSEEVWERAQPLMPAQKPHPKGGRPPCDDRQMLGAMLYVLRTGIQWNALPREIGASTTVYDRFRAWDTMGSSRACGQQDWRSLTRWWALRGSGKAWMG